MTSTGPTSTPMDVVHLSDGTAMSIDDTYRRYCQHDPSLLAALHHGEPEAIAAVGRMLRMTPLSVLATHLSTLVAVLTALPQLHDRLRGPWTLQDAHLTTQVLRWSDRTNDRSVASSVLVA